MNVEDRLTKLERENRNWRRVAFGLVVLVGASLCCTQGTQTPSVSASTSSALADASQSGRTLDTIRVRKLEIVNSKGEIVVTLSSLGEGDGFVLVEGKDGDLTWLRDGYISLKRKNGDETNLMGGHVALQKKGDKDLIHISCGEGGGGIIEVYNPYGKVAVSVQSNKTNQGAVYVHDVSGEISNMLTTRP